MEAGRYGEEMARRAGRVRVKAGGAHGFGSRPDAWSARTCEWQPSGGCHLQLHFNFGEELEFVTGPTPGHCTRLPVKGQKVRVGRGPAYAHGGTYFPWSRHSVRRVAVQSIAPDNHLPVPAAQGCCRRSRHSRSGTAPTVVLAGNTLVTVVIRDLGVLQVGCRPSNRRRNQFLEHELLACSFPADACHIPCQRRHGGTRHVPARTSSSGLSASS